MSSIDSGQIRPTGNKFEDVVWEVGAFSDEQREKESAEAVQKLLGMIAADLPGFIGWYSEKHGRGTGGKGNDDR